MGFDERDPSRCLHPRRRLIDVLGGNTRWSCDDCYEAWTNDYEFSTDELRVPIAAYEPPTPDELDDLRQRFGY